MRCRTTNITAYLKKGEDMLDIMKDKRNDILGMTNKTER